FAMTRPSPKSKGHLPAAVGLALSNRRRNNCAVGWACETDSFTREVGRRCSTARATRLFCSASIPKAFAVDSEKAFGVETQDAPSYPLNACASVISSPEL